jgi:prephenate dehydrogenase
MDSRKITIAGLGLIGGSLARAFRRTNPAFTIIGVDTNPQNLRLAEMDGTVDMTSQHWRKPFQIPGLYFYVCRYTAYRKCFSP